MKIVVSAARPGLGSSTLCGLLARELAHRRIAVSVLSDQPRLDACLLGEGDPSGDLLRLADEARASVHLGAQLKLFPSLCVLRNDRERARLAEQEEAHARVVLTAGQAKKGWTKIMLLPPEPSLLVSCANRYDLDGAMLVVAGLCRENCCEEMRAQFGRLLGGPVELLPIDPVLQRAWLRGAPPERAPAGPYRRTLARLIEGLSATLPRVAEEPALYRARRRLREVWHG